jgi:hypothetical protein
MSEFEERFAARLAWYEAQQAKWDAMERAELNANPFWWRTMLVLGLEVCRRKRWFIAPT